MLHLRRLSYFLAVIDHGTLTAAATELLVAQPALSRQIKLLEQELSLTLFVRERGRLVPTRAGMQCAAAARTLLSHAERTEKALASMRDDVGIRLVCATTRATNQTLLSPFLTTLSAQAPIITTHEVEHHEVENALSRGADFAIAPLPPSPGLESRVIGTFPILAMVGLDHPWALQSRTTVALKELVNERLLLSPRTSISRQEFDRALRHAHLSPKDVIETEVDTTQMALAQSGRGVAVTTGPPHPKIHAVSIADDGDSSASTLTLYACWQPEHYAAQTLEDLAEQLIEFANRSFPRE